MEDFAAILKIEDNSSVKYTLNDIFSCLADEPESYPVVTNNPKHSHYFLRFNSPVFSEYALGHKINLEHVSILPVNQNLRLVEQYQQARSHYLAASQSHVNQRLGQEFQEHDTCQYVYATGGLTTSRATPNSFNMSFHEDSFLSEVPVVHGDGGYIKTYSSSPVPPNTVSGPKFDQPDSLDRLTLLSKGPLITQQMPLSNKSKGMGITVTPSESLSALSGILPITCESRIYLTLCGEIITFDLEYLFSDPRMIIELLKATKSERGNYVVVAAFYRRKGYPGSAKGVLLSMIEEFSSRGVTCEQHHPAFLLLSGCELDLARRAKNDSMQEDVISEHYSAAQKWLQKVFGKGGPRGEEKENYPGTVYNTPPAVAPQRDINRMEREIQTLRYRNAKQESQLSELHSSKRKVQDDFCYERDTRRKLQRRLEELEKERDTALRMERYALDQVKSEVLARKRATDSSR